MENDDCLESRGRKEGGGYVAYTYVDQEKGNGEGCDKRLRNEGRKAAVLKSPNKAERAGV